MDFNELILKRYSVRAYKTDAIEQDTLDKILEAGRIAPTAANRQPFQVFVIPTAGKQKELKRIYNRDWFSQAPLVIGVCGVVEQAWVRQFDMMSYLYVDAAIVMDHIVLAASNLGLGTCWIAAFDPQAAKELLHLPAGVEPILFTPLGYPNDEPKPKSRKPLRDIVHYITW